MLKGQHAPVAVVNAAAAGEGSPVPPRLAKRGGGGGGGGSGGGRPMDGLKALGPPQDEGEFNTRFDTECLEVTRNVGDAQFSPSSAFTTHGGHARATNETFRE